jgi:BASS family bile acid:Na+ symporter
MAAWMKNLLRIYSKVLGLLVAMALGALLPQFHSFSFLIQYLLMVMLFFAFMDVDFQPGSFPKNILWVLLANLTIAFMGYWVLAYFNNSLALAAFITGIAPTAITAPVIVGFIKGRVEYVLASVLLTNIAVALVVPFALPFLVGAAARVSVWEVLQPVLITMFTPLILARLALLLPHGTQAVIRKGKRFSFPLWMICLFIICAKAVDFLRNSPAGSAQILVEIALVSLAICVINFSVGALIGGREYWQESSQALGQKNNTFAIWIALTFINPLVAMGPTFYVLYHNLYNSFQIYLFEKRNALKEQVQE